MSSLAAIALAEEIEGWLQGRTDVERAEAMRDESCVLVTLTDGTELAVDVYPQDD